jgi:hypothetical protein
MQDKTVWWMILFGIVRHALGVIGAWLASRGLIDADTQDRLLSEGATQIVGWLLMLLPVLWSVAQKLQVTAWIRAALHIPSHAALLADVPEAAGSKVPL